MLCAKVEYFYAHIVFKRCDGKTSRTQNSALISGISDYQSYPMTFALYLMAILQLSAA